MPAPNYQQHKPCHHMTKTLLATSFMMTYLHISQTIVITAPGKAHTHTQLRHFPAACPDDPLSEPISASTATSCFFCQLSSGSPAPANPTNSKKINLQLLATTKNNKTMSGRPSLSRPPTIGQPSFHIYFALHILSAWPTIAQCQSQFWQSYHTPFQGP